MFAFVDHFDTYTTRGCFFHLQVVGQASLGVVYDNLVFTTLKLWWRYPQHFHRAVFIGAVIGPLESLRYFQGICKVKTVFPRTRRPFLPLSPCGRSPCWLQRQWWVEQLLARSAQWCPARNQRVLHHATPVGPKTVLDEAWNVRVSKSQPLQTHL